MNYPAQEPDLQEPELLESEAINQESVFPDYENVFPEVFPFAMREKPGTSFLPHDMLRRELRECLLNLSYSAFLGVVAQLLERIGHQDVRLSGRKGFVGRNRAGGWDLETVMPACNSLGSDHPRIRCIIQAKQFTELSVQQRTVDELRGCCLRTGAGQGILITTSQFSPVARRAAEASVLAPVTLIDGERLLDLLVCHKLGLSLAKSGKWKVDSVFFKTLDVPEEAFAERKERNSTSKTSQEGTSARGESYAHLTAPSPMTRKEVRPTVLHFSITLDAGTNQDESTNQDAGKSGLKKRSRKR